MDAPDELVEAVAEAIADADTENDSAEFWELYQDQASAVLSVPALAEVIARDAKVREIVDEWYQYGAPRGAARTIAALYPEAGKATS